MALCRSVGPKGQDSAGGEIKASDRLPDQKRRQRWPSRLTNIASGERDGSKSNLTRSRLTPLTRASASFTRPFVDIRPLVYRGRSNNVSGRNRASQEFPPITARSTKSQGYGDKARAGSRAWTNLFSRTVDCQAPRRTFIPNNDGHRRHRGRD